MSDETRRRAEEIFQEAADRPPDARDRFIREACGGDADLQGEVRSLLRHFELAGEEFLARPAFDHSVTREFEVPERIGRYRIVNRIGEGGMGVVFEAEQDSPRRRVALKVIRPGLHGPDVRRRFEYEAEILARLQHPSIAHVYDAGVFEVGRDEGIAVPLPYFAMELVRGPSIDRWVQERGVGLREIVGMMATVADAVEAAHLRGVIHRDLKPANVVVDEEGRPKVLDFGLARAIDAGKSRSLHTGVGTILGTMPYVSPEQLSGDPDAVDLRTDVYSLGVLLLELLIGEPPVDVGDLPLPEAIRRMRDEPLPRPSRRNRRVDDELETIVQRATHRDRHRRYASAGAFAEDLRRYLQGEPIEAKRDSGWYMARMQIRRHRTAFGAGMSFLAVLLVATIVSLALYVRANVARQAATDRLWEAQLQQARAARESETIGRRARGMAALAAAARLRPDRALRDEAIACMALDDLELEREVRFEGTAVSSRGLAWIDRYAIASPDGGVQVRTLVDSTLIAEIPPPETEPMTPVWLQFDPPGRRLAVRRFDGTRSHLTIWDLDPLHPLLELDQDDHSARSFAFVRAEDGSELLIMALDRGALRVLDLVTGTVRVEISTPERPVRLTVDPHGRLVALSHHASDAVEVYEAETLRRVATLQNDAPAYALAFAAGGDRLVAGGSDYFVRVFDLTNPRPRLVLRGHQSAVVEAGVVAGTNLVVTGSWDQTIRFWDCDRGREVFSPVKSMYFNAVGDRVVLQSPHGKLAVWRYEKSKELVTLASPVDFGAPANGTLFDRGSRVLTAGANGVVEWDAESGALLRVLETARARDVEVDARRRVAVATTTKGVMEFPLRDPAAVRPRLLLNETGFEEIAPHPEGWIASGRQLVATFGETGILRRLPHPAGSNSVEVSADGRWVFVGTWHGEPARLIDNATLRAVRQFAGPHVRGGFDPTGRWLAVVDGEQMTVLAMDTWQEVYRTARGFPGNSLAGPVTFSPDGSLLATTLDHYRLELFRTGSFESITTLANPDFTTISKVDFSRDGQRLLVVGTGPRAHVWDLGRLREELGHLGLDWARDASR